MKINQC